MIITAESPTNPLNSKFLDSLLPHPVSSLSSMQSTVPSQRREKRMHVLLLHRNAPLWQETVQIVTSIVFRYNYYATGVDNCQNGWKTHSSSSHHFHQNMTKFHCIEQRWRHTAHCYIETVWSYTDLHRCNGKSMWPWLIWWLALLSACCILARIYISVYHTNTSGTVTIHRRNKLKC